MANSLHVKKGDRVQVIAGKDKGVKGTVLAVDPKNRRVTVEGVNKVTKHRPDRSNQAQSRTKDKGGLIHTEAPIDASNVQLLVKADGKEVVTRVGYERREVTKRRADGTEYETTRSVRIARKTGKEI